MSSKGSFLVNWTYNHKQYNRSHHTGSRKDVGLKKQVNTHCGGTVREIKGLRPNLKQTAQSCWLQSISLRVSIFCLLSLRLYVTVVSVEVRNKPKWKKSLTHPPPIWHVFTHNRREMAAAIKHCVEWMSKQNKLRLWSLHWLQMHQTLRRDSLSLKLPLKPHLLVITEGRLKFSRAYGGRRELASHCHLQWMKPLPLLSSRKCIWNTLLTSPLLMSIFIAPWFQVFSSWQAPLYCSPNPDRCLCQRTEIRQWWRYFSEDLICLSRAGKVHLHGDSCEKRAGAICMGHYPVYCSVGFVSSKIQM